VDQEKTSVIPPKIPRGDVVNRRLDEFLQARPADRQCELKYRKGLWSMTLETEKGSIQGHEEILHVEDGRSEGVIVVESTRIADVSGSTALIHLVHEHAESLIRSEHPEPSEVARKLVRRLRNGHAIPSREMMVDRLVSVKGMDRSELEELDSEALQAKYFELERHRPIGMLAWRIQGSPTGEWIYAVCIDEELVHAECVIPGADPGDSKGRLAWTSRQRVEKLEREGVLIYEDVEKVRRTLPPHFTLRLDKIYAP